MTESTYLLKRESIEAEQQTFCHPWNPNSCVGWTRLGRQTGLSRTGVSLGRVPPGKESFTYHMHHVEEEWLYILQGHATAVIDGASYPVEAGDFMGFPPSTVAHQLRNTGEETLVYLMGGENRDLEVADFPDLDKRLVRRGEHLDVYTLSGAKPLFPAT